MAPRLSLKLQVLVMDRVCSDCFGSASVTFRDGIEHPREGLTILLGCVNTDHWDLAIDTEEQLDSLAGEPSDIRYPRSALPLADLRYLSEGSQNCGTLQAAPETAP